MEEQVKIKIEVYNRLIKDALKSLLAPEGELKIVEDEEDGLPEFIIIDQVSLSKVKDLHKKYPGAHLLLIDNGLRKRDIISVLKIYKLSGIIAPYTDLELFKKSLKVIKGGQLWIDNNYTRLLIENFGKSDVKVVQEFSLTPREREIIEHVCRGLPNKDIAEHLGISVQTVKTHINRIFKKLGVSTRTELVRLFLER